MTSRENSYFELVAFFLVVYYVFENLMLHSFLIISTANERKGIDQRIVLLINKSAIIKAAFLSSGFMTEATFLRLFNGARNFSVAFVMARYTPLSP